MISAFLLIDVFADNDNLVGINAPFFKVASGEGKALTLDDLKGKVTGIFYETTDVVKKNRKLKDQLNIFYNQQPDSIKNIIVKLPVINCKGAFWPFTGIWRSKLRKHSKKEDIVIYGDWDGAMGLAYNVKDKESNIFIIDKKGIIRYYTFGKIEDKEIKIITDLLKQLSLEDM